MTRALFLAPHSDDEALFGAFTLLRVQPVVLIVTDGTTQYIRDGGPLPLQRWHESVEACGILGCAAIRGRVNDSAMTMKELETLFDGYKGFDWVYAPALQGGNPHHDMVHYAAVTVFKNLEFYSTYSRGNSYAGRDGFIGHSFKEVVPTEHEIALKNAALRCYRSQNTHPYTKHHFDAVQGRSEWLAS